MTATARRACGFGDGSDEWRPAQARASGEPSAQPSHAWRRRRDEQLLAQALRQAAPSFFPNLVFLFDFFLLCAKDRLIRLNRKTEPRKPKPNSSVLGSAEHRSVPDIWKPNFAATEQTEPNCRLKPNAQAEIE